MKTQKTRKSWLMIASMTLITSSTLMAVTGCSNNYHGSPPTYKSANYYPYDYYYYPSLSVYFHISSGYYYYRNGRTWARVRTLPPRFYLDSVDRVRIVVKSNKPYLNHEKHRVHYSPRPTYRRDLKRNQHERKSNNNRYNQYKKKQHGRR